MSCCDTIANLAQTIFYDLGQPTGQPPTYIQSRLMSAAYIGKLNSLIGACYVPFSGCIEPTPGADEQAVYASLYNYEYYSTQLNRTLQGINPGVVNLRDGDSSITFSNPVEIARMYRDARASAYEEMVTLVGGYRGNAAQPQSVDMSLITNSLGGGSAGGELASRGYYRS